MNAIYSNLTTLLILLFFGITYFFSIYEKLTGWKGTIKFYKIHFDKTFVIKHLAFFIKVVVVLEIICLFILLLGMYYIINLQQILVAQIAFILSAITLLILLIGQRIAKDYTGAMNVTIYFILNCFGIYILT
ncbi:DoxX family protein [Lutibacter sp.]|uniref:DoxX family protein n=1 Tax=Lutibacter sp. TaxID=1925666 RepID=UPI00273708B4|nr:DoxX family protein [Lutibacter sp.]MDP3313902.1 DoxX family protein [Lutibacter sp.]